MIRKVGPHVIKPTSDALDWARHANVVKALDDTTALRQAPQARYRIFRKYFPAQDINRPGNEVVDAVLAALGDAPATHVEIFNETAQRLGQGLEDYVSFTDEAVRHLADRRPDLTLVAFCFSTGNPEQADWDYLRQHEYGGATCIGLHEYWGNQGFTGWNALRYRKVHEWTQGDHPPFLITECGRDRVEGGQGGYIADGVDEDRYIAEIDAFDMELQKDAYVLGATCFTGGPTPDWQNFTTDPLSGRLVALTRPLPEDPTVPDIVLNVPMRTSIAATENYSPGPRAHTIGVVIHTTRGGTSSVENEYTSTINWFQNPAAQVSAHLVVGGGTFAEVCRSVHDDDVAWHCREANATHLGIEIAQAQPTSPISDFQYVAAADACKKWSQKYGFPLVRVMSQNTPGLVGHEDTEAGKRDGKTDPGQMFDWARFMRLVTGGTPVPTPDPAQLETQVWALGDQLMKLGDQYASAGYPHRAEFCRSQGNSVKEWVNTASKLQR